MKKIILLFALITFLPLFSQQDTFTINWDGTKVLGSVNTRIELPGFQESEFGFDYDRGLTFVKQWESDRRVNENSIQITNILYSNMSRSQLKDLNVDLIPSQIVYKLVNSSARGSNYVYFELSPIINQNGNFKKVTSFTIKYDYASNVRGIGISARDISNSVLRSGSWYRFYVEQSGVHRISKGFLEGLGIDLNNIDPKTIKIFGNGGRMLPLLNSEPYPIDLQENAIQLVGEEDGEFDNEDHILFYAEGPINFNQESITHVNAFTDKSYYYVNISAGEGKRIVPLNQPTGTPDMNINTYSSYQHHEIDDFNIVKLGRRWFGNRFNIDNEQSFEFNFPDLITSEPINLRVFAAAISETPTTMDVSINGSNVTTFSFIGINDPILADGESFDGSVNSNSSTINIGLNYNNNGNPSALAYLDFISLEGTSQLNYSGVQFIFKNYEVAQATGVAQYSVSNASNVSEVWDITDIYNVRNVINVDADSNFSFTAAMGSQKEYIAVDPSDYYAPSRDTNVTVANQDLKGTLFEDSQGQFQDLDYIIVTRNDFVAQANRLADINRAQYGLTVKVLTLEQIYNEFSSGNPDVGAIRNMVKYVYDNASVPENRLKYLCLFGDASYDYKDRIARNTNIVPSWHAYSSFNLTNSFISDDFYGMMDDNEGSMLSSDRLDIAVGRVLAETPQRAKEVVDKVELYYQKESYGSWRNNFLVVSDDVDVYWEEVLQRTTNEIADEVTTEKPFINAIKVHSDSYIQEASAGGDRYPEVTKAMSDAIEVGALVVNYFGHGGEDGLAKERIFEQPDAQNLRNICKFNCFVTVTCEYTKFDNPDRPTAGEYTYWNKDGGAIGLITTTRQIFVTTGVTFNRTLSKYLFAYNSDEYPSMAESLRLTKIDPSVSNINQKRLVFFIGDPAMKLAFAKPNIRLSKINDVPIGQPTDTLKALSRIKIEGEVVDISGNLVIDYNGILSASIYDKNIDRQTLANDRTRQNQNGTGPIIKLDYKTLGEIIFRGQATIVNGLFTFEFVVPRDIGIPIDNGRISFYAKTENPLGDQAGVSTDILVGGINENAPEDNVGPTIQLYMNDENFVSGGITNESPTLLAKLEDENGMNTASGIGHDIVATIDGDETNPFVLNDYYETELDVYQRGTVSYAFRDLEPGIHTLTLKAWDVYNNSSTQEIQFVVYDKDQELVINNVLNYPNPFINYTEFWFNHNSSDALDVSVQVFTVSGKLVKTINGQTNASGKATSSLSRNLVWDGKDDFGDRIGKGVYVYKLTVRSNQLNKTVEKYEKLVIL